MTRKPKDEANSEESAVDADFEGVDLDKIERVNFTMATKQKFELAEQDNVERLSVAVERILRVMGFEIDDVLVTDESMVADFVTSDEDLVRVRNELGVEISPRDYVWQVAERLGAPEISK